MSRIRVLPSLSAERHVRHAVHREPTLWIEKNCYVDVIIELVHALGLEPVAAMGFCAAIDFEGDNFTFFKPQHEELRQLFGIDIQEMNVWRPLLEHAEEHLRAGKFLSTEADAFWLPDTAGTDYRRNHVKTTIIMAEVDRAGRRLGYFHNASYHELGGEDFERTFERGAGDPTVLPFFAELIRVDRLQRRAPAALAAIALARLAVHLERRPRTNPLARFAERFGRDLPALQAAGIERYHVWAFATTRQLGAAAELLAAHLRWLGAHGEVPSLVDAAEPFLRLSADAKTLILKAARAVSTRRPLDTALLDGMAAAWSEGIAALEQRVPRSDISASLLAT